MSASRKMRELNRARIEHDKSRLMAGFAESRKEMVSMVDAALASKVEALMQQLASRDAEIAELMTLLSRASITIGSFIEGNDWAQSDMDTMDSIDALIYRKALAATEPTKETHK